jgi:hypothetical protein
MGPSSPMVRLHYLAAPLILFWWFYSLSILDPTNVGWLKDNEDPFQAFLGWTAFRFSDWQWPLGLSRLVAYPNGMPLIATDSNPLVSIPLKLLSPLLPYPFQFEGWWLLISVFLSYILAFGLFLDLSGRPLGSALGAALVAIAPIFPFRWLHNSLSSQWLILAAFSIFLRPRSDGAAVTRYAGLHALVIALHPYYVPMVAPIAGMDLVRRSIRRLREQKGWLRSLAPLVLGSAAIAIAGLIAAWVTGILVLTNVGGDFGLFTMDPLAWFNPMGTSSFLPSWTTGWGQYEGYQYLGLGGFLLVLAGAASLALRRGQDARRLGHAALWLTPAFVLWYVTAVSPTVTAFGHVVLSPNIDDLPLLARLLSIFRSSGRFGWPITYFVLLSGVLLTLTVDRRAALAILAAALLIQVWDLAPLGRSVKAGTAGRGRELTSSTDPWRAIASAAKWIYVSPDIVGPDVKNIAILLKLGSIAFPGKIPMNRFYYAQDMSTGAQTGSNVADDKKVLAGESLDPGVLYLINNNILEAWTRSEAPALSRLVIFDGRLIVPPADARPNPAGLLRFAPPASDASLYGLVKDCSEQCALALAVQNDGSKRLSGDFVKLMNSRGAAPLQALAYRGSYAALLVDGRVIKEAASPDQEVVVEGRPFDIDVRAVSGGANASNTSALFVNGANLSPDRRGFNVVELRPGRIANVRNFDTYADAAASEPDYADSCPYLSLGETIQINDALVSPACLLRSGWSEPEGFGTWSESDKAVVALRLAAAPTTAISVTFEATAFSRRKDQDIEIAVKGTKVGHAAVAAGQSQAYSFTIPQSDVSQDILLTFDIGDPVSPFEVGKFGDRRQPGIGLMSLRVDPVRE